MSDDRGGVPPPAGPLGRLRRRPARAPARARTGRSPRPCPTATSTAAPGTWPRPRSARTRPRRPRSSRRAARPRSAARTTSRPPRSSGRRRLARRRARAAGCCYAAADAAWLAGLADRARGAAGRGAPAARRRGRWPNRSSTCAVTSPPGAARSMRGSDPAGRRRAAAPADPEPRRRDARRGGQRLRSTPATPAEMRHAARPVAALTPADRGRPRRAFFAPIAHGDGPDLRRARASAARPRSARRSRRSSAPTSCGDDPAPARLGRHGPLLLREARHRARRSPSARSRPPAAARPSACCRSCSRTWPSTRRPPTGGPAAQASYHEAIGLARETGQQTELALALAGLAWLRGAAGQARPSAALHAAEALGAVPRARHAAVRDLGDRPRSATSSSGSATPAQRPRRTSRSSGVLAARGIDRRRPVARARSSSSAYLRLGRRPDDAEARSAGVRARRAQAKGQPWSLARAVRCRGLLAADDELDRAVRRSALACTTQTPDVFETARTRLAYGARLRRARHRVRAREQLRAALDDVRAPRRRAVGRAGAGRAGRDRRDRAPAGPEHARRADAAGAADRAAAGRREDHPGGRGRAVPQPEDDRVPPAQRLPQARHRVAKRADRGDGAAPVRGAARPGCCTGGVRSPA